MLSHGIHSARFLSDIVFVQQHKLSVHIGRFDAIVDTNVSVNMLCVMDTGTVLMGATNGQAIAVCI